MSKATIDLIIILCMIGAILLFASFAWSEHKKGGK